MAARVEDGPHPVRAASLVGFKQNGVPLGNIEGQTCNLNGLDERAVGFNDRKRVIVNAEANVSEVADVDETQAVTEYTASVSGKEENIQLKRTSCLARR